MPRCLCSLQKKRLNLFGMSNMPYIPTMVDFNFIDTWLAQHKSSSPNWVYAALFNQLPSASFLLYPFEIRDEMANRPAQLIKNSTTDVLLNWLPKKYTASLTRTIHKQQFTCDYRDYRLTCKRLILFGSVWSVLKVVHSTIFASKKLFFDPITPHCLGSKRIRVRDSPPRV